MNNNPTPILSNQVYARSIVGKVRDHNEDAVLATQWPLNKPGPLGLEAVVAVADGMGGHERGEWASQTALTAFMDCLIHAPNLALDTVVTDAIAVINNVVYSGAADSSGSAHPGTTFTVAMVRGNSCSIGHVGDSRLYLLRTGMLEQITEDHSWAGELVRQGQMTPEQAANWVHKNQITRAIGIRATVEPAIYSLELRKGDVLLLCSDGLSGMISDEHIADILATTSSANQASEQLCNAANNAGGEDNISTVLYAHGNWPAPRVGKPVHGPRSKTLVGGSFSGQKIISPNERLMRKAGIILLIIGLSVMLGIGIRMMLNKPITVPTPPETTAVIKAPSTSSSTIAIPSQKVTLKMEWDKEQNTLKFSLMNGTIAGDAQPNRKWVAGTLKLTQKDKRLLDSGMRPEIELAGEPLLLSSRVNNNWSLKIDKTEVSAYTIKLDNKIIANFNIRMKETNNFGNE